MNKRWLPLVLLLVLAFIVLPLAAGCGETTTTTTAAAGDDPEAKADAAIAAVTKSDAIDTPATIKEGILMGGSDTAFPPFEFSDGKGGYIGFDIDILTAVSKKMGLELEVVPTAWDGIIPALVSERYDVIMSAMSITDERLEQINFSDSYYRNDLAITTPVDKPIPTAEGLVGKVVGVQVDTTGQFAVEKIEGVKEIKKYENIITALQDLEAGRVEAVVNDEPSNAFQVKDKDNLANTGIIEVDDEYGFGIKKEKEDLLAAINQALKELEDEGVYELIRAKWFGDK
jgi:polar amino acid transport system substrate-binding protein